MYVLYALQLKLWLRSNAVSVFFITQIGHRPRALNSKQGLKKETEPHYDYSRTAIWRWRKKAVPETY